MSRPVGIYCFTGLFNGYNMKVSINYVDTNSLTVEEVVKQAEDNYGKMIEVTVSPESTIAYDYVYFGVQQLITHRQISIMYEKGGNYQHDLKDLRRNILSKMEELIDQVIVDNESKIGT